MRAIIAFAALLGIVAAGVPRPMYIGKPVFPKPTPFGGEELKINERFPTEDIDFIAVHDGIESQPKSSGPAFPPPEGHIFNGNVAYPGQFPWQAAIDMDSKNFCGGSLIAPNVVLTAGHCVKKYFQFTVMLGAHLLDKIDSTRVIQVTDKGIVHDEYIRSELMNDIALLLFENAFPLTDRISTIALPTRAMISEDFRGYSMTVSGWGFWNESMTISPVLNYVNLPVMPNNICATFYERFVRPTNICCEGAGGRGSCQGDSGGPVIVKMNGKVVLAGVVSYGSDEGCDRGLPSVFTRVSSYLDWIQNNTGIVIQE